MREAFLTVGMLLIFAGCMGAISGSTLNTGASISNAALMEMAITELVSGIIAFAGAILVLRYR